MSETASEQREKRRSTDQKNVFKQLLLAFLATLVVGTFGYWYIEGWSFVDSFFMTVITITTVGYKETGGDLSDAGKIFTVFLIFTGFGVAALALSRCDHRRYTTEQWRV